MRKWLLTVTVALFAVVFAFSQPATAGDGFGARLRGLEEVPSISTTGQGFVFLSLNDAETAMDYTLVYFGLEGGAITQSHIHVGQTSVNGGIVLFFCTNLTPPTGVPAPPACPSGPVNTVTGTLTAANVIAQPTQGIAAEEFAEVIRAMRAGYAYANVHSTTYPGGEIRGQISR
jgi:CHRD domain